jgi:acyl carrier protein
MADQAGMHDMNHNEIERTLSAMLTGLLKQDLSDPERDLMDCGLTSILAIQVISRIRDLYDVELPIMVLFQMDTGTVAGLSRYIATVKQFQTAEQSPPADSKELVL